MKCDENNAAVFQEQIQICNMKFDDENKTATYIFGKKKL